MQFRYRYTKHQVARGARADAETNDAVFLIKRVSSLRLTYQIRLLLFRAVETRRRLVIQVPKECRVEPDLRYCLKEFGSHLRIERV